MLELYKTFLGFDFIMNSKKVFLAQHVKFVQTHKNQLNVISRKWGLKKEPIFSQSLAGANFWVPKHFHFYVSLFLMK